MNVEESKTHFIVWAKNQPVLPNLAELTQTRKNTEDKEKESKKKKGKGKKRNKEGQRTSTATCGLLPPPHHALLEPSRSVWTVEKSLVRGLHKRRNYGCTAQEESVYTSMNASVKNEAKAHT